MKEIGSAAQQSVPTDLPFTVADYWEHNKGELIRKFQNVLWSAPGVNLESPALTKVVSDCQRALRRMFGRHCLEVAPLPAIVTEERLEFWARYNLRPVFLPELDLTEGCRLPKRWIRPNAWFYQKLWEGKIGEAIPGLVPTKLRSGWYLADFSIGVDYNAGTQVFTNDPWAPLFERLRREKLVGKYDETPMDSRFAITNDEWIQVVLGYMSSKLGFPRGNLRLERASEFNAIGNLYDLNRGKFIMWVWLADSFDVSFRLLGGNRGLGGLTSVNFDRYASRYWHVASRPLVVLS
ncbi:MAG: hypothetical protein HYT65_03745 [Candidatus Yanofskybacteria bacterium]|nr:hypothetical protein [Candidatus Yanofskybacteria bacterium]